MQPFGSAPAIINEARLDYAPASLPRLIAPEKLLAALQEAATLDLANAMAAALMHPDEAQSAVAALNAQAKAAAPPKTPALTGAPALAYAISQGLEERGITVRGVNAGNDILDGPMTEQASDPAADVLPAGEDFGMGAPQLPVKHAALLPNGHAAVLDVSEGTALDPLQDKSWDLNSAKSVPAPQGDRRARAEEAREVGAPSPPHAEEPRSGVSKRGPTRLPLPPFETLAPQALRVRVACARVSSLVHIAAR